MKNLPQGLKGVCAGTYRLQNQSRRGRLNLAQDVVLG